MIRLKKMSDPSCVRIRTDSTRKPDIGLGILVAITEASNGKDNTIEYYGEYIGHGQSKTAFVLDRRGAKFHDKVLKVNNTEDMEPTIFTKASEHNLTTSIYYNCGGVDTTANREKIANAAYVTYYWETGKYIYTKLSTLCRLQFSQRRSRDERDPERTPTEDFPFYESTPRAKFEKLNQKLKRVMSAEISNLKLYVLSVAVTRRFT